MISSAVLVVLLVVCTVAAPSLVPALTRPGTDSVAARLAEWGRTHGFSSAIDSAERLHYKLNPPKTGGSPRQGLPTGSSLAPLPSRQTAAVHSLAVPPRVRPPVRTALPGEGIWHLAATVSGSPALATAFLRPDATHTSYVSALVWMNPQLLRFSLHPGHGGPRGQQMDATDHDPGPVAPWGARRFQLRVSPLCFAWRLLRRQTQRRQAPVGRGVIRH